MSRRPLVLALLAVASALAAAGVWIAALFTSLGRRLDGAALDAFTGVAATPLHTSIAGIAVLADPLPFVVLGAALTLVALLRGRPLMAAVVPLILVGANVTTQLLKPALADPRVIDVDGWRLTYPGSWPSGHSTAAMSLALCLVLVVGPQLRPLAALAGAGYAIAVGYSLVALGWHLPSDVFGGFLVAATFALLGAAILAQLEARRPAQSVRVPLVVSPPALAAAVVVLGVVAAGALLVRAPSMALGALDHPAAIAAGAGIAALGIALTAGLAVVLRR